MKRWIIVALVAASSSLIAGDAPGKRRVLVADVVANGIDKGTAATLTSVLVARVGSQPDVQAYSGVELKRLMSLEADKAACGSDESCIAEITGALGAPLAVLSDVGKLGALTIVNLTLFDVENAAPLARAAVEAEKLEELPQKLDKAVANLLHAAPPKVEVIAQTGTGRGGGGSGEGTIGLGSIGTIGHGSGSGSGGYGSGHKPSGTKPSPPKPPVEDTSPPSSAKLSAGEIQGVVRKNLGGTRFCYEKALAEQPDLAGKVTVRFLIAADGSVAWASIQNTEVVKSSLPKCIVEAVQSWKFPAKGAPTTVSYPFVFKPAQ